MPLTVCTTVSKPRRNAHGPTWLNAHRETNTMPGRTFASASGEKPRVPSVPGRYPCENTSASRTRRWRSEEHTSELQSPYDLVCRLLLEKKKTKKDIIRTPYQVQNKTEQTK